MQLPVICYTCDATESSVLFKFTARIMQHPEFTLGEVLRDLTNIDPPQTINDKLPQRICFACTKKLASAYMFVRQARTANDLLMQHLEESEQVVDEAPPIVDCLPPSLKLEIDVENSAIEERADPTRETCPIPPAKFKMDDSSATYLPDSLPLIEVKVEPNQAFEELVTDSNAADPLDDGPMDANIFSCIWCKQEFSDWQDLVSHLQCHGRAAEDIPRALMLMKATTNPNGAKRVICMICNKRFLRIVNLGFHIQLVHNGQHHNYLKPTYSITNEMGFELQFSDSETEDECSMSMSYRCELCQFQSKRKYEMMRHQDEVHSFDELPYECKLCIFKCVSQNILEQHLRTQCLNIKKKHICEHCGYKFMWPGNLEQHCKLQHSNQSLIKPESTTDKSSSSKVKRKTNYKYSKSSSSKVKKKTNYKSLKSSSSKVKRETNYKCSKSSSTKVKRETRFKCSTCYKSYFTRHGLKDHIIKKHMSRIYSCDKCVNQKFSTADELEIHIRRHQGNKPYFCEMCVDIEFRTAAELQTHHKQRIHDRSYFINNDMSNLECSRCRKILPSAKQLKEHFKKHLGVKVYKKPMGTFKRRKKSIKNDQDRTAPSPEPRDSSMDATEASSEPLVKNKTESEPSALGPEPPNSSMDATEASSEPLAKNTDESKPTALNSVSPTISVVGTKPLNEIPSDPNHSI